MTRTSWLDFGSGLDADLAHQWDTKGELFSLAEGGMRSSKRRSRWPVFRYAEHGVLQSLNKAL